MKIGVIDVGGGYRGIYAAGVLDEVFQVNVHRVETEHGTQYYCTGIGN